MMMNDDEMIDSVKYTTKNTNKITTENDLILLF